MAENARERLMLVDNLDLFFGVLCKFRKRPSSIGPFREGMEESLGHRIHVKTAHTYFYTATILGLFTPAPEEHGAGSYILSDIGTKLCVLRAKADKKEYRRVLKSLLTTNPRKGKLFRKFIDFIKDTVSEEDVYREFEEPTGKTLIAWCVECGVAKKANGVVSPNKPRVVKRPSVSEFWKTLLRVYRRLQQTGIFGAKRFYIPITDLRIRVCAYYGMNDPREFDGYLRKTLETEHGSQIELFGAPPHLLEREEETFNYKGKRYAYISIGI